MHPYITAGGYAVPAYWLTALLGLGFAAWLVWRRNRVYALPRDDVLHIGLMAIIGAVIGSKLLYLLTILPWLVANAGLWLADPELLLTGGAVFYGGLYGALLAAWLYCRKYRVDQAGAAALYAPALPLFHAFGRLGCFLTGCCWGVEWERGIVYREALAAPNNVPLLPVQLIEAGMLLLIFCFLLLAEGRLKEKHLLLPVYLTLYSAGRFILEFFRGDELRGIFLLSTSQWIAIATLAALVIWYVRRSKRQYGR